MLNRTLSYYDLLFIGIGNIIGGGVFSLMGLGIYHGKGYTWLLLLLSGFVMWYMSQAYMDIKHKIKDNKSEFEIAEEVGGKKVATAFTISSVLNSSLTSAVISLAFGAHINKIMRWNMNVKILASITIVVTGLINVMGIRESTTVVNGMTIIELTSLIVLSLMLPKVFNMKQLSAKPTIKSSLLVPLIMIFAFTGGEALPKLAGETINNKDIPRAINHSIGITTILYALTSIVMISVLGTTQITKTPMVDSYKKIFGNANIIGMVALFSIFNTILMSNISGSRTLYGYGVRNNVPLISDVNERKTPHISILLTTIIPLILIHCASMDRLAIISNVSIMFTMIMININAYKDKARIRNIVSIIIALLFSAYAMF